MLAISIQGLAWILLRACSVNDTQLITLLQPFNGLFPSTQDQYNQLCVGLRRMGHIIERSPGNIASQLRGSSHHAPTFFAGQEQEQHGAHQPSQQADPWTTSPDPWAASFNNSADGSHPSYPAWPTYPAASAEDNDDSDNGTDSDTISSCYDTEYQMPADLPVGASDSMVAQSLYWAYQRAKGHWRRFMGKPVRRVRRFLRRKGKGKSKCKGKGKSFGKGKVFLAELPDDQVESVFKGKGRGK